MAELANGGMVRGDTTAAASTRPSASASGVGSGGSGAKWPRMYARASATPMLVTSRVDMIPSLHTSPHYTPPIADCGLRNNRRLFIFREEQTCGRGGHTGPPLPRRNNPCRIMICAHKPYPLLSSKTVAWQRCLAVTLYSAIRNPQLMRLKIALAQMRCEKGDWAGNLVRVEDLMAQAAAAGCDVIIFPEMSLSGYCDPARFPEAVQPLDGPGVRQFVALTA